MSRLKFAGLSALVLLTVLPTQGAEAQQASGGDAPEPDPVRAGQADTPATYLNDGFDALHYDVELALPLGAGAIEGHAMIRLLPERPLSEVRLDFTGLRVDEVSVDDAPTDQFTLLDGVLVITPAQPLPAGREARVAVRYSGVPDDGLILGNTVHGRPSAFVDNWPNRTRFWLPSADHPSDKATARLSVHAPAGWQLIANGRLIGRPFATPPGTPLVEALEARQAANGGADAGASGRTERRTWIWQTDVPHPTYTLVVGGAELEVDTVGLAACGSAPASPRVDGCVEVTTWLYPEDAEAGAASFVRAAEMVDFFSDVIGPFPYEKLAHVQSSTRFGGMENSSAIFYDQGAIAAGRNIETTVSHETAHQWFGDSVTEADWSHLWLSEGFATYFGHVFFEYADGVADFARRMAQVRETWFASNDTANAVIGSGDDLFALLNRNNYQKGAAVLHMLRDEVGDEAFFEAIAQYYARFADRTVLTEDLQAVFEETTGRELGWFFEQWLRQPGYPLLKASTGASSQGGLEVTVTQLQGDHAPRFRLSLTLAISGQGVPEGTRRRVELTGATSRFSFPELPADARVELDPGQVLLARIAP